MLSRGVALSVLGAARGVSSGRSAGVNVAKRAITASSLRLSASEPDFELYRPLVPRKGAFMRRHVGPKDEDVTKMLEVVGFKDLDSFLDSTVPEDIRVRAPMGLREALSEREALQELKKIASLNEPAVSMIGMGYYNTHTPSVILRNMLEDPGWYTSYSPYQSEISQGRLEMLLNFQTMVTDLTGMAIANASLLDEATAAAEGMFMAWNESGGKKNKFFASASTHPQVLALLRTRGGTVGIDVVEGDVFEATDKGEFKSGEYFGVLAQYPDTYGYAVNLEDVIQAAHEGGAKAIVGTDLLACTLLTPPGEMGADIVYGSAQRFGVPMGFGGPHAAFFATTDALKRRIPGRVIGMSRDSNGDPALRLALQTREQHIRRDKATSNICTAQALLANMAASYAIYHGPQGLKDIAGRIRAQTGVLAHALREAGYTVAVPGEKGPGGRNFELFDTLDIFVPTSGRIAGPLAEAIRAIGVNVRLIDEERIGLSLDETTQVDLLERLVSQFEGDPSLVRNVPAANDAGVNTKVGSGDGKLRRSSAFLEHAVFNSHHSETNMMRYLRRLASKDFSLGNAMIPLGSCTMKLNPTSAMLPVSWPEFANVHPFAPRSQVEGYHVMLNELGDMLAKVTRFDAVSVQPNSGAQGEYAGLLAIRRYHDSVGDHKRDVCLIPASAHGTNPASAVMAGLKVVVLKSDEKGNVDQKDLQTKIDKAGDRLAALMVTYPSTYGVFEEGIRSIIDRVHQAGGQVYLDGANMNAQTGLTSPGSIGADVCHLNLHKTMSIPHGGGGPGVGAIGVRKHLAPFLPGHCVVPTGGFGDGVVDGVNNAVSAAPYGSALILPITWMYFRMLGEKGARRATEIALLNANYMAARLSEHYKVLYKGPRGQVAHELIVDLRSFKAHGITEEDVAKRLADYGFHAPTMSWPVPGTVMIEPTESEDLAELDRFCESMIAIRREIDDVVNGKYEAKDSPLKAAPHTVAAVSADVWDRKYSRQEAAFPLPHVRARKFWPAVGRVDNVLGDRNLVCTCPPLEDYE